MRNIMHFAQPTFLLVAVALAAVLTLLFAHQAVARRRALLRLGSRHLLRELTGSVSTVKRRVKEVMLVLGVVLVAVALARPQLGFHWEEAHRRGVDILFAVDTSKSMLTPDVKPNRLERAKLAVHDLVTKFPDDRVGLVAFAGSAFLETPLTLDHAIFDQSLATLDTKVIPLGGTNVASAIDVAEKALSDDTHKKLLVLLTDGEDLEGNALVAAEAAAKKGLVVYTVGVGTPGGELIPLHTKSGATAFVKDASGQLVTSKLDEDHLRRIAAATGGTYRALGDNGQGLDLLYEKDLSALPRSDLAARSQKVPIERFQWPLGAGMLLLALEPLVGERRRMKRAAVREEPPHRHPRFARGHVTSAAAAALALLLLPASAYASPQSAERAYHGGQFTTAEQQYANAAKAKPDDRRLAFNLGDAAYRSGDLGPATKGFEDALHTGDLKLQEQAYYNLGDALYRTGQKTLKDGKTDDTIRTWKQAVAGYEAALRLDSADADAKWNRDFVNRRLAELQKKQDDQDKQDKQNKKDDQKKDGQKQSKSGQADKQSSKGGDQDKDKGASGKNGASKGEDGKSPGTPQQGNAGKPGSQSGSGQPQQGQQPQGQQPQGQQPQGQQPQGQQPGALAQPTPASPGGAQGTEPKDSDTASAPGELSKAEARGLLDSLRGELELRAKAPMSLTRKASEEPPRKDW
jgi:Ca-activated chloride channel family protein